jgi:hypothetical protein
MAPAPLTTFWPRNGFGIGVAVALDQVDDVSVLRERLTSRGHMAGPPRADAPVGQSQVFRSWTSSCVAVLLR